MMKKLTAILFATLLSLTALVPFAGAARAGTPRLVDMADILTDSEEAELLSELDSVSEVWDSEVIIVTTTDTEGSSVTTYADDIFDYIYAAENEEVYGADYETSGILFLLDMGGREWAISTRGTGIQTFTDAGQKYITGKMQSDLSDGYYADAFDTFIDECDDFYEQAATGEPYDVENLSGAEGYSLIWIPIALVVGLVLALIVTLVMKSQLKSVEMQAAASDYLKRDSFQLSRREDIFLRTDIVKTPKPKDNDNDGGSSTHFSSSGTEHGGSSGRF